MKAASYPCPLAAGGEVDELALSFDRARKPRVLIIPALFDEASKLRRLAVEVMRRLDGAGIDSILPDLPGTNESLQDASALDPEDWATACGAAARSFGASHIFALRGGALLVPEGLPGWIYAPAKGANLIRTLLRARLLSEREAGREASTDALLAHGLEHGLELGGYPLSAEMLRQMLTLVPPARDDLRVIEQDMIGGSGLWLRAEPGDNPIQADALAAVIAMGIMA